MNALTPTHPDDRIMAGLAHITAIMPFFGVIAPIVIWVTQKDKSRYVAFQALQAVAFQILMIVAWFAGWIAYMVTFFTGFFLSFLLSSVQSYVPFTFLSFMLPFGVMGLIFLGGFALIVYAIVAAILTFQGKPFRYALIGPWIERFVQARPPAADPAA